MRKMIAVIGLRLVRVSAVTLLALVVLPVSIAQAAIITLDPTARGVYFAQGNSSGGTPTSSYVVGENIPPEIRDFFAFSLSSVTDPVVSATMTFALSDVGYGSPDATETLSFFDYLGSIPALVSGTAGVAGFNDLGTGAVFGTRVFSAADNNQTITIALSANALSSINAALGGPWAFGGALTTLGNPSLEFLFGNSLGRTSQLTLETAPGVPEPALLTLLGLSVAGVGVRRWRQRKAI
jgi:hypothetical protein